MPTLSKRLQFVWFHQVNEMQPALPAQSPQHSAADEAVVATILPLALDWQSPV